MNLKRHLVSFAALAGFAFLALGSGKSKGSDGSSSSGQASSAAAKIGDNVSFEDSDWVVVSAKNLGKLIKSPSGFGEDKKTDGQFIEVEYKVTNKQSKQDSILDGPKLLDDKKREFGHLNDESMYLPNGQKSILLENLPPSMAKEYWTIFEVPADATGFKFQARSLAAVPDTKLVDLGTLAAPAAPAAPPPAAPAPSHSAAHHH